MNDIHRIEVQQYQVEYEKWNRRGSCVNYLFGLCIGTEGFSPSVIVIFIEAMYYASDL